MGNRLLGVLTAGALLSLSGCAGNKAAPTTPTTQAEKGTSDLEQQIAQRATGSQEGKIKALEGGELVLVPYDPAAGEATLAFESKTPVFEGNKQVSLEPQEALKDGDDVKVYYQARADQPPLVLGVTKLDATQAKDAMSRYGTTREPAATVFGQADGMQEGKIARVTEDELVLRPYAQQAGEADLAMGKDVKVLRDGAQVGREALSEGSDVRVFFDLKGSEKPQVVGVELLSADQARELENSEQ